MFSLEQVRDIVQRTCDERERVLREHYERVLQQKLQGARPSPLTPAPSRRSPHRAPPPHARRAMAVVCEI